MNYVNFENSRTEKQRAVMKKIQADGVCPFCPEYFSKYHDKPILKETDSWSVTENFQPYEGSRVHLLFIPKNHFCHIEEVSQEDIISLFSLISWANKEFDIRGATVLWRYGDTKYTGGSVSHLHVQLISGDADNPHHKGVRTRIG